MVNHKNKAILFGAIPIITIGAIVIISLWPASKSDNNPDQDDNDGDGDDGDVSDSSRLNLINLHYRITNHTIITTTSMVVFGCLIIIILLVKGYVSRQKRRKKEKKERSRNRERQHSRDSSTHYDRDRSAHTRDFSAPFATNGTWGTVEPTWAAHQVPAWGPQPVQYQAPPSFLNQHHVFSEKRFLSGRGCTSPHPGKKH